MKRASGSGSGALLECLGCGERIPMRGRGLIDLFVIRGTATFKIRRLRGVLPIFNRRAWQIVGVEGRDEIGPRYIVGGVHKRCTATCDDLSGVDVMPHDEMSLNDVRDLARTTITCHIARRSAPRAVAVA